MRHHHSFAIGLLGGLTLTGHPLILIATGVVIGVVLMQARAIVRWIGGKMKGASWSS